MGIALACLLATTPVPAASPGPPAPLATLVDDFHVRSGCPGVTVGYVLPDGTADSRSAGMAFTETNTPLTGQHRMMAGSTGKTLFAALVLQLAGEGVLELDALIAPSFDGEGWYRRLPNAPDLTLRMLLNHTSGIPRYVMRPEFADAMSEDPDRHWRPVELLDFILDREPLFPAGEDWAYADTNFLVAAVLVERVTGESCYSQIHGRILRPHELWDIVPTTSRDVLGLAGGYVDTARNLLRLTEPNVVRGGRYVFNPQFEWAGGGFATTPRDLARWASLLYGGDVLDDAMQAEMRTTVPAKLGPGSRYGLGMMQRPAAGSDTLGDVIGHAGYFPGYLTEMAWYAQHRLALAVQVNTTKMSRQLNPRALQELLDACASAIVSDLENGGER